MRSKHLLLMLLLALMAPWAAAQTQETFTVYATETGTNDYIPIYGLWGDANQQSEFIIPASELADIACGTISKLTFHISSTTADKMTGTAKVYLREVDATSFTSPYAYYGIEGATQVYEGEWDTKTSVDVELPFTSGVTYTYNGGNLLVGFIWTTAGDYKSASILGKTFASTAPVTAIYKYGSGNITAQRFIPRTTFTYTPSPYVAPASIGYTNNAPGNTTVSWTAPTTTETVTGYAYRYKKTSVTEWPAFETVSATTLSTTLTLDPETGYDFEVKTIYGENESCSTKKVSFTTLSSCMTPEDLTITNVTWNSATFNWTEGFGNGEWKLGYKTGNDDYTYMDVALADLPLTLDIFEENTTYSVEVYPLCDPTKKITDQFNTRCEPIDITALPNNTWAEDFTDYSNGTFTDNCWENKHISGEGTSLFEIYSSQAGYTKVMQLPDQKLGTLTKLMLPAMILPNSNYHFVLDVYRSNSTYNDSYAQEGIRVFASANGEIQGATEITFIPRQYTVSSTLIPAETAVGWYTYELPINMSGLCYIILRGESQYCTATYMDNFVVEQIPTCAKPSSPMLNTPSARTAHTATLKWTNGEEGQNAWQIAYSTQADFDPATVTPVDVTTNPATLTGLTANTQYYAYVRANCGNGDFSSWSTAKASFKTTTGIDKPTNLSVDNSTITSTQARVKWKAVTANDLHENFQLFYSRLSTKPADNQMSLDSLITVSGTIDTTYLFTNLTPEKKYYVWVRDICGTDGNSDWTSSINFTTASACQTPTGLAESNVTSTSATFTWNTFGLTEFNIRYKTGTDDWTTISGIACPYTFPANTFTPNTTYQVQVQPTCADEETWSSSKSFTTDCDAISVATAYSYDFEDAKPWNCWNPLYGTSRSYSSTSGYTHSGTYRLLFSGTTRNMIALPEFTEETNTLQINFWTRPEGNTYSSCGTFDVGYMTNLDDTSTFVRVERYKYDDWADNSYIEKTVYFDNAPNGAYIAFRHNANATNYYWFVDDVEVSVAPDCRPVRNLEAANILHNSADLTWVGINDAYTVQYRIAEHPDLENPIVAEDFEDEDEFEENWTVTSANDDTGINDYDSHNGDQSFLFVYAYSYSNTTQTLVSSEFTLSSDAILQFWYRNIDEDYDESFYIGTSSTTADAITYGTTATTASDAQWHLYSVTIPSTTKYIGIKYVSNYYNYALFIDDLSIAPVIPAASTWSTATTTVETGAYTITVPNAGTKYDVRVRATCADDLEANYASTSFTTIDNNTMIFKTAGNWNDAGNWEGDVPSIANNAIIRANVTIPSGYVATANKVTIEGTPAPTITLASGGQFLHSTDRLLMTVEMTIPGYGTSSNGGYRLISIPSYDDVDPEDVENLLEGDYDLYAFDATEENEWRNYKATPKPFNTLYWGTGYLYANKATKTLSYTGTVDATNGLGYKLGDDLVVTTGNEFDNWVLVGNSTVSNLYLSYYDDDDNPSEADFYVMNGAGNGFVATSAPLAPGQGAFVEYLVNGYVVGTTADPNTETRSGSLNMNLSDNNAVIDNARLRFGNGRGLSKFSFRENSSKLYIPQDDKNYAVVYSQEKSGEMPVSFKAENNGSYTLSFNTENVEFGYLHLIDNMTGKDVNLLETPSYSFEAKTTDYASRFKLVFSTGNGVNEESFAFISDGNIILNGEGMLQVVDVMGRIMMQEENATSVSTSGMTPGVYVLRLINGDSVKTQKIVIK